MAPETIPTQTSTSTVALATAAPPDPETLLTRRQVAAALTAAGYPTAPATLARKASVGGGPKFSKWGRLPIYRWADALEWAQSRLSPPVASTSELDCLRQPKPWPSN
jgi:hypothetical protein